MSDIPFSTFNTYARGTVKKLCRHLEGRLRPSRKDSIEIQLVESKIIFTSTWLGRPEAAFGTKKCFNLLDP
jgi:hypothetical protein